MISSYFLLENIIQQHLGKHNLAIALNIKDNMYEDNLVTRTDCEENEIKLYTELKQIFKNTLMRMRTKMRIKITKGK